MLRRLGLRPLPGKSSVVALPWSCWKKDPGDYHHLILSERIRGSRICHSATAEHVWGVNSRSLFVKRHSVNWRHLASFVATDVALQGAFSRKQNKKHTRTHARARTHAHTHTHQFSRFKAQPSEKRRNKKPRRGTMRKHLTCMWKQCCSKTFSEGGPPTRTAWPQSDVILYF